MSAESVGVSYLTLSYLIEIAVVMNLAYRELKFPELDNKLHEKVNDILSRAEQKEIHLNSEEKYKEYGELKSLVVNNGTGDQDLWGEHLQKRRWFFNKFIRNRLSLKIVNFNIVSTILILIGCTAATGVYPPIENVFLLDDAHKKIWAFLFVILVVMTVLPMVFIRMGTLCEVHLFGAGSKEGLVPKLSKRMFKTKSQEEIALKKLANEFKAP